MTMHQFKLTAAGVVLALGLGVGGGAGWLAPAGAQGPRSEPALTAEEKVRQLEAQLARARRDLEDRKAAESRRASGELARLATARWQYALVPVKDVDAEAFGPLLREREAGGWDYAGQAMVKKEAVWVFRRPTGGQTGTSAGQPGGGSFNRWATGTINPLEPGHGTYPRPPVTNPPPDAADPKPTEKKH